MSTVPYGEAGYIRFPQTETHPFHPMLKPKHITLTHTHAHGSQPHLYKITADFNQHRPLLTSLQNVHRNFLKPPMCKCDYTKSSTLIEAKLKYWAIHLLGLWCLSW